MQPLNKADGSPWLVLGNVGANWWQRENAPELGDVVALDIHYDGDDPTFEFKTADDFAPLPNAKELAHDYNAIARKDFRLYRRRATSYEATLYNVIDAHYRARNFLMLAEMIRANPDSRSVILEDRFGQPVCGYHRHAA